MKFFTKKSIIQKIILAVILLLFINFTIMPYYSYAGFIEAGMSALAKELLQLLAWFGDVIMSGLNNFMLGAEGFGSSMLDKDDPNLDNEKSWLYVDETDKKEAEKNKRLIVFNEGEINTKSFFPGTDYSIPNMLYSPENIFANRIAALDVNFFRENEYESIYAGGQSDFKTSAEEKSESSIVTLRETIAGWYKSFRNITIVGLLSVLVYIGIRILLSSTAADKAKYKENLTNWVVGLCLVFFIHFMMSAVLMLTDKCTELFGDSITEGYIVEVKGGKTFRTNLIGLVRFSAQADTLGQTATYTIIYIALVIYTCIFTFLYLKRLLYMSFFTMIAPLVALTYPIDKIGDGKAQATNKLFSEYITNALQQPLHLILYTALGWTSYDLAIKNPLFGLAAIAFLLPAEKFVKQLFIPSKGETAGGFGSFAGGAVAMKGLQTLSHLGSGGKDKGKAVKDGNNNTTKDRGIFMPPNSTGELSSFGATDAGDGNNPPPPDDDNPPPASGNPLLNSNKETIDEQLDREKRNMSVQDYRELGLNPQQWEDQRRQEIENERREQQEKQASKGAQQPRRNSGEKLRPIRGYTGRLMARGAKAAGRQIWKHKGGIAKTAMKATGLVAGASLGLAAGLTTGDLSKTMSFIGAGALAGSAIGSNAQSAITNLGTSAKQGVINAKQSTQRALNEEKYGFDYAREVQRQQQNKKARKEFLKDDEQKRQYRDLAAKMGYEGDVKNLMQAAADYKEAGITNDKLVQNSLQAEYARNGSFNGRNHEKFVEVASFAHENNFTKDNITDAKKREQLDTVIDTIVPGDENAKREAALMYADIFDSRSTYEKVGKFGATKLNENKKPANSKANSKK